MRAAWIFSVIAATSSLARADAALEQAPSAPIHAPFWKAVTKPNEARAEQLVRQGRALLYPALGLGLLLGTEVDVQRRLAIESSLARFARAVELMPTLREARLYYGKALSFWEDRTPEGAPLDKTDEAIAQLESLRKLDALYEAEEVAFQLGVLYTRRSDFARAIAEYRRSLALKSDDDTDSALLGNLAEVTMLTGDVPTALSLYERAASESEASARVLALWGSAVALDRLGEHAAALARAQRALEEDRAPFAVLHQNGVFFVPAHELHYYEGLGNLALVEREREGSEPVAALARAGQAWLGKPDSVPALSQFERALAELTVAHPVHPGLLALRARVARARTNLRARMPSASSQPGALARELRDAVPSAREARLLLWLLRALAAFELYLQRDGGAGPFAEDAREHRAALLRSLSAGVAPTLAR
ncbi:MAG: hypothetical protein JWN48_5600 [Myxococcaceae bacterium]|nr:hypothetical protein [Myxococcaceae bacterium]